MTRPVSPLAHCTLYRPSPHTHRPTVQQMFGHSQVYTMSQWHGDALPQRLFASAMYSLTSGVCLRTWPRVCACVHTYVGVCCLSSRYLACCVSSHVQRCTSLPNAYYTAAGVVCVRYLCVAVCFGPHCVVSDLNFMAGWVSRAVAAGL